MQNLLDVHIFFLSQMVFFLHLLHVIDMVILAMYELMNSSTYTDTMTGPQRQHFEVGTTLPFRNFMPLVSWSGWKCYHAGRVKRRVISHMVLTPSPGWNGRRKFSSLSSQSKMGQQKTQTQLGGGNSYFQMGWWKTTNSLNFWLFFEKGIYPPGNWQDPQKWHFEDDVPFPKVGYVNSLEGTDLSASPFHLHLFWHLEVSVRPLKELVSELQLGEGRTNQNFIVPWLQKRNSGGWYIHHTFLAEKDDDFDVISRKHGDFFFKGGHSFASPELVTMLEGLDPFFGFECPRWTVLLPDISCVWAQICRSTVSAGFASRWGKGGTGNKSVAALR